MNQKVILLLIPNLNFGGAQRVFYNLSIELSRKYKVIECVFNFDEGYAFKSGNEVISLDVQGGNNFISKVYQLYVRYKKLKAIKKSTQADICISHLEGADLVNVLSRNKEITITWVHGSKQHDDNITGFFGILRHRVLIPFMYAKANIVVCVSAAIKQELVNEYRVEATKIQTIHNYFDIKEIKSKSQIPIPDIYLPIFTNVPVLIFSGRLVKQKNPVNFLNWFASFIQKHPAKLVILGDGEMREEVLRLCSTLKLKTYHPWSNVLLNDSFDIYFLGFQENPHAFIRKANLFVLPSLWEGFPMVLGEAMSCGIPIVSADCETGPFEMLSGGDVDKRRNQLPFFAEYGILLPLLIKSNMDYWTETLIKLLSNQRRLAYYSSQSLKRAEAFSKERNINKIMDLIDSIE